MKKIMLWFFFENHGIVLNKKEHLASVSGLSGEMARLKYVQLFNEHRTAAPLTFFFYIHIYMHLFKKMHKIKAKILVLLRTRAVQLISVSQAFIQGHCNWEQIQTV